MCGYILEKFFPDGVVKTQENIQKIRELIISEYGIDEYTDKNDRNIWTKIERNPCCILGGNSKYTHINNIIISDELLSKIKSTIDFQLQISDSVSTDYIFAELGIELIEKSSVKDKYALYGVIKLYFKN